MKDYVKIWLDNPVRNVSTLMNMKALENFLPQPQFLRVHRSYIVNTKKIQLIDRQRIIFGDVIIPIADSSKDAIAEYISKHTIE